MTGQHTTMVTGVNHTIVQLVQVYRVPVPGHLRCFPSQGFLLVLVSEARAPRTFPRHLFPDLLRDLFGLCGGRMEYVVRSYQPLVLLYKVSSILSYLLSIILFLPCLVKSVNLSE